MEHRVSAVGEMIADLEARENVLAYLGFLRRVQCELSTDVRSGSIGRASRMIEHVFGKAADPMQE